MSDHYVTRTIRISSELDEVLKNDSELNGRSVNSIVEGLINKYADVDRYNSMLSLINLAPSTLSSLLSNIAQEKIEDLGRESGRLRARDNLLIRGMPLNYSSLEWFIMEVLDKYSGWFNCSFHEMDKVYMFHLRHDLGIKWSCYVQGYLEAMVKDILDLDLEAEVLDGTVTLRIPVKMT